MAVVGMLLNFANNLQFKYSQWFCNVAHICVFFVAPAHQRKYFNDPNFPTYGIGSRTGGQWGQLPPQNIKRGGIDCPQS